MSNLRVIGCGKTPCRERFLRVELALVRFGMRGLSFCGKLSPPMGEGRKGSFAKKLHPGMGGITTLVIGVPAMC